MPRQKPGCPQRLVDETREELNWNLGDVSSNIGNTPAPIEVIDLIDDSPCVEDIPEHEGYVPLFLDTSSKDRRKKKKKDFVVDHVLQGYLNECNFYIEVQKKPVDRDEMCAIGTVEISSTISLNLPSASEAPLLYLYISANREKCLLYSEKKVLGGFPIQIQYWPVTCNLDYNVLKGLCTKRFFRLYLEDHMIFSRSLTLCIVINEAGFHNFKFPSEHVPRNSQLHLVQKTFSNFLKFQPEEELRDPSIVPWPASDIASLYSNIRNQQKSITPRKENVQHADLIPILRPYQAGAVRWMITREEQKPIDDQKLHSLFGEAVTTSGEKIYYQKYRWVLTKQKPKSIKPPCGGILADEMGLGKTVEVLACILSHPRPAIHQNFEESCKISDITNKCVEMEMESASRINKNTKVNESSETIINDENKNRTAYCFKKTTSDHSKEKGYARSRKKARKRKLDEDEDEDYIPDKKTFNTQSHNYLEFDGELHCLCGLDKSRMDERYDDVIKCNKCGTWQHPECVNFDVEQMPESSYLCPHCWARTHHPIPSRATLVVSPSSISYQWQEEIEKHLSQGAIKYMVYSGVGSDGYIQPATLADYDIVLTTYKTLRKELNYVNLPHSKSDDCRRFRNPKRFMAIPSPLVAIEWWRVCLDEAQMVERTTTKTAEMTHQLAAVNRWCITGTPIGKSVEDLYGLLCFLGEDPYWVNCWWTELLYKPYCNGNPMPLLQVMKNIFWRTAKEDVLHEIGILEQVEQIHWLSFSPVEEHFYKRQHQICALEFREKLRVLNDVSLKLSALDKHTMTLILNPLRSLRQACCHPQAVRGRFLPLQKTPMTMEELLTSLIKKTKSECEEIHRQLIAALNGLASIHIIREEYVDAVEKYRDALRSVEQHGQHIKTDKIQQLHALHNLAELLEGQVHEVEKDESTIETKENSSVDSSLDESMELQNAHFSTSVDSGIASEGGACDDLETTCNSTLSDLGDTLTVDSFDVTKDSDHSQIISAETTLGEGSSVSSGNASLNSSSADPGICMNGGFSEVLSHPVSEVKMRINPPAGIGRTLQDENIRKHAQDIRHTYLTKCTTQVNASLEQLEKATQLVRELEDQFRSENQNPWWHLIIKHALREEDEDLVLRIKGEIMESGVLSVSNRFHTLKGVQYIVTRLLSDLHTSHKLVSTSVRKLSSTPRIEDVNAAIDCHLRPSGSGKKCVYCIIHEYFNQYEGRLFYFDDKTATEEPSTSDAALFGQLRRGTWADSELERILKSLHGYSRLQKLENEIIEDGVTHIKFFDVLKKEFRALRGVWMRIRDMASALDELEMAKIRLRVRLPDEPSMTPPVPYILEPEEVEPTRLKLISDRVISQNQLMKKLGQLFYLQNLAKADFGKKGGSNPEPCPICQKTLGVQWSVLLCGHCFCISCIRILIANYTVGFRNSSLKCPVCRQLTPFADVSYVNTQQNVKDDVPVKGSHSTKVDGVVRCLMKIRQEEPEAKALVFSTWNDMLDIVGKALQENGIPYISLFAHNKFQNNLVAFKHDPAISVLLLPVHSGANGLNLIEANHVLLVEPILNTGSEQQAVGRVHRIGQTKATTVHKFIVQDTIEEKIHYALQPHHTSINKIDVADHSLTVQELGDLF